MALCSLRLVDDAHMGGDDAPALPKAHPGLHLAADRASHRRAVKLGRGHCEVAAVARDHRLRQRSGEPDRRARGAEGLDLLVAVEALGPAIADGARVVAE